MLIDVSMYSRTNTDKTHKQKNFWKNESEFFRQNYENTAQKMKNFMENFIFCAVKKSGLIYYFDGVSKDCFYLFLSVS